MPLCISCKCYRPSKNVYRAKDKEGSETAKADQIQAECIPFVPASPALYEGQYSVECRRHSQGKSQTEGSQEMLQSPKSCMGSCCQVQADCGQFAKYVSGHAIDYHINNEGIITESAPAKNVRKDFHWPAISGLLPVFRTNAIQETAMPATFGRM